MFNWHKKEKPLRGLQGMGAGIAFLGTNLVAAQQTFNGPGSPSTNSTPFTVPAVSSKITITTHGARGGNGNGGGGTGAYNVATFAGLAGQTLIVRFAGGDLLALFRDTVEPDRDQRVQVVTMLECF